MAHRTAVELDRPIFLTGCCKSGTTMLGMIFLRHPDVGPKESNTEQFGSLDEGVKSLLGDDSFNVVAHEMEHKEVWDEFFPMNGLELRIGRELTLLHNPLSEERQKQLIARLTCEFSQRRFFSKHPSNCFRAHALREMFPDAKLLAVHRDGRDVVSSWGRRGTRWKRFGGHVRAIELFARKWNETIDHIETYKAELAIHTVRYEDIVRHPAEVLRELFRFCDLPPQPALIDALQLRSEIGLWRSRIPEDYHDLVNRLTRENRLRLGYPD